MSRDHWFSSSIRYEGRCKAEFISPRAILEGIAQVLFDDRGACKLSFDVEYIEGTFRHNSQCMKITVNCDEGIFSSNGRIEITNFTTGGNINELFMKLEFSIIASVFEGKCYDKPAYWVVPLVNFHASFIDMNDDLLTHPLIRENITTDIRYGVIAFKIMDEQTYIDRLPNYRRYLALLNGRRRACMITSIIIGGVGGRRVAHIEDILKWFDFRIGYLLSFICGNDVGLPWFEIRSASGILIRRFHLRFIAGNFHKGYVVIDGLHGRSLGEFLTNSLASGAFDESNIKIILQDVILAGQHDRSIEDKCSNLFRAYSRLISDYKLRSINLLKQLKTGNRGKVQRKINELAKALNEIAESSDSEKQGKIIRKIRGKLANITVGDNYGKSLIDLMKKFDICDLEIVKKHYEHKPRADKRKWEDVISAYRGTVVHEGFFRFYEDTRKHDRKDVFRIFRHLHDIIIRIIFKILKYEGTYISPLKKWIEGMPVDWIKSETRAEDLGYIDEDK